MDLEESNTRSGRDIKLCFKDHGKRKKITYYDVLNYDKLIVQIARTLGYGAINCRFSYIDDEDEEITITCDADLQEAFNLFNGNIVKLKLNLYEENKLQRK